MLFNAEIDGGNDDDIIRITTTSEQSEVDAAAANQSTVSGGAGNDSITFVVGTSNFDEQQEIAGLLNSQVYGNDGDDIIRVSTGGGSFTAYVGIEQIPVGDLSEGLFYIIGSAFTAAETPHIAYDAAIGDLFATGQRLSDVKIATLQGAPNLSFYDLAIV